MVGGVGGCPVGAGARGLEREVAEEAVLGEGVSDADIAHRAGCGGDGDQSLMMLLFLFNTRNILHCGGKRMALPGDDQRWGLGGGRGLSEGIGHD